MGINSAHLFLRVNDNDVLGDSTVHSMGREDSIECVGFEDGVWTPRDQKTGRVSGRRVYEPLRITKRVDRSTPLLAKALSQNEKIEAEFKFYRPCIGAGGEEHFFTIKIDEGRIASIKRLIPNLFEAGNDDMPMTEEVTFVFHDITWTYEIGGATHTDHWSAERARSFV